MLRDWLAPRELDEFLRTHLRRLPHAAPGAASNAVGLFGWDTLERILTSQSAGRRAGEDPLDVLVATRGRLASVPPPKTLRAARTVMAAGLGIVIRRAERHDAGLAELARRFGEDLPGEVHVQLYVTPAGTQTFGWHFDLEDVFIAQTVGRKDYYFRENTVAREAAPEVTDFRLVQTETSPIRASTLIPGDWLYIPSRWWHLVRSTDDALSISIGVVPRSCGEPEGAR